ncbi:hypothetical protein RB195_001363 [Necator americanus]|uniref:Uncharacterized protein n=1 Tax=Necator americanus TaxID=51031 RepID=A0ABR1DF83_NECAM
MAARPTGQPAGQTQPVRPGRMNEQRSAAADDDDEHTQAPAVNNDERVDDDGDTHSQCPYWLLAPLTKVHTLRSAISPTVTPQVCSIASFRARFPFRL